MPTTPGRADTFVNVGADEPEATVQETTTQEAAGQSLSATDQKQAKDLGYSGTQTATVVGITYRQLDYWARTDLIRPSLSDASGSGSRRRYSYSDLLELKAIKKLLDSGIKLEQVRKVFEYLRQHVTSDIASAHIVIDGSSVNVYDGDQLIDVLRNGQGVLNVLSLGGVKTELEADLAPVAADIIDRLPQRRIG
jgi:DNA-binding transcriptional MerR regulator